MTRPPREPDREPGLVITYREADLHYHRQHLDQPNRPMCQPSGEPGVLVLRSSAVDRGLVPCPRCWPRS